MSENFSSEVHFQKMETWHNASATGKISCRTVCGSSLHAILPRILHEAFRSLTLCSTWALLTAMTMISRLMTSAGRRSMASWGRFYKSVSAFIYGQTCIGANYN
jgi:hypothetical protein